MLGLSGEMHIFSPMQCNFEKQLSSCSACIHFHVLQADLSSTGRQELAKVEKLIEVLVLNIFLPP